MKKIPDISYLLEKVKTIIRKVKKSRVLSHNLEFIQTMLDVPTVTLIKVD
jgi:hypothetical protein